MAALWEDRFWAAVEARDRQMDPVFVFAVRSTGVYCRPSCPSRRARRDNVLFFDRPESAEQAGYRACLRCRPDLRDADDPAAGFVERICRYMEANLDDSVSLEKLGREAGMNPFHLQRKFKAITGISPRAYADFCRLRTLKAELRAGRPVTDSLYSAGYGSSSRLYERSASQLGMTPRAYRRGGAGIDIRWAVARTAFGPLLVASTASGICSIQFGESRAALEALLRSEFPAATIEPGQGSLSSAVQALEQYLAADTPALSLPLDIHATAFQRRVWEFLQTIPRGATKSYAEVAAAIGAPQATRAVARACAANPAAIAIPCHRVVRKNGDPGGYRWGVELKKKLLSMEGR